MRIKVFLLSLSLNKNNFPFWNRRKGCALRKSITIASLWFLPKKKKKKTLSANKEVNRVMQHQIP